MKSCPYPDECGWPWWSWKCNVWWDNGLKWKIWKWFYILRIKISALRNL